MMRTTTRKTRDLTNSFILLMIAVLISLPPAATLANTISSEKQENILLENAVSIGYLPIVGKNYFLPHRLRSPFSLSIPALHEVVAAEISTGEAGQPEMLPDLEYEAWLEAAFPSLLQAFKNTGATTTRVELRWSVIEPAAPTSSGVPTYYWGWYDHKLQLISQSGIQTIAAVVTSNPWAANPPCGAIYPNRMNDFARFMADMVRRYKEPPYNIKFWEIINEPDGVDIKLADVGQGCWGFQGAQYAQMLKVVYPAIKAVDPTATVLMGGVAHDWFVNEAPDGRYNRYFMDDVMAAGGGGYIDALNFHFFTDFRHEWERWDPNHPDRLNGWIPAPTCGNYFDGSGQEYSAWGEDLVAKATHISNRMSTCFGVNKPIFLTETSAGSYENIPEGLQFQAHYVTKTYARGISLGIPSITWYAITTPNEPYDHGLIYSDFSPKPAFYAYKTVTVELGGNVYKRSLDHPYLEGYYFRTPIGKEKLIVWLDYLWAEPEVFVMPPPRPLDISPANQVRVVDYLGALKYVDDGGPQDMDGAVNGSIRLNISINPVYIVITSP
jgi:hypothetical protein